MLYRKLKRTWSYNDIHYIPRFKQTFPELKSLSSEELCDRFASMGVDFYQVKTVKVHPLIRLTLPFALIIIITMLVLMPIMFIITGEWGYDIERIGIANWFRSLKLCN